MLYNDFISAGITLEEIALIEKYAMINNLEFSEDTNDLCLINSITEEVTYRGLSEIIAFLKKDFPVPVTPDNVTIIFLPFLFLYYYIHF